MTGEASYMVTYNTWKRHYAMYCVCPVQNSPDIGEAYFSSHICLKGMTYPAQVVHLFHIYIGQNIFSSTKPQAWHLREIRPRVFRSIYYYYITQSTGLLPVQKV